MSKLGNSRKEKAVELAGRYTPSGGRILEVSCGTGRELLRLQKEGYQVAGTNYTKYENESPLVTIEHAVDLLKGLPFEDASFDTVMLLDVIEHLANHDLAISELARVCKAGGHVIVMTPNIMRLRSRLHFLFTGFFKVKRAFIGFDVPRESAFAFHNNPVHLPVLFYHLHANGLSLAEFTASVYKRKSFALYAVLWPLIAATTWFNLRFGERHLIATAQGEKIRRCLTSVAGLCGEFLFVVSCKAPDCASSPPETITSLPKWSRKWETEEKP